MAKFFKYRNREELLAENQRLSINLRFDDDLSPLFQPVNIGPLTAGNAMCIQPMEGCDGTLDGTPDALTYRRYQRFGAGGAKLIWAEATAVIEEGRANTRQLYMTEQNRDSFEKMLQECRQAHRQAFGSDDDLIVGLQLTHSGRYSHPKPMIAFHDPILDPRTKVDAEMPIVEDDYLKRLVDHYVHSAKLAHQCGYQFIDIKQCHRYFLSEMLAAKTRPGPYGGSLENRTRLATEIIQAIRAEVPELLIGTRLNVFDCIPFQQGAESESGEPCPWKAPVTSAFGTSEQNPLEPDLTEPKWWISKMIDLGVSIINVSMGSPYATPHVTRPFEYPPPDGYESPEHPLLGVDRHFKLAAELHQSFPQIPMVGSGYSYLQEYLFNAGAANLRENRISFIGVGRASLSQPDFAAQLMEHGKLDRKRVCRTFSYCTALMRSKHNELGQFATGCPPFDKEVYNPIWKEAKED